MRARLARDLVRDISGVDVLLAIVMSGLAVVDVFWPNEWNGPRAVNLVVVTGYSACLVLRRRYPNLTLVIVLGSIVGLGIAFDSSQDGRRCSRWS